MDRLNTPELKLSYIYHDILNLYIAAAISTDDHNTYLGKIPTVDYKKSYSPHYLKKHIDCRSVGLNILCKQDGGILRTISLSFRDITHQYIEILSYDEIIPNHPKITEDGVYHLFIPLLEYQFSKYKISKDVNKYTEVNKWLKEIGLDEVPVQMEIIQRKGVEMVRIVETKLATMNEKQLVNWLGDNQWNYDDTVEIYRDVIPSQVQLDHNIDYCLLIKPTYHLDVLTASGELPKEIVLALSDKVNTTDVTTVENDTTYTLRYRNKVFIDILIKAKDLDIKLPIINVGTFRRLPPDRILYEILDNKVISIISIRKIKSGIIVNRVYKYMRLL